MIDKLFKLYKYEDIDIEYSYPFEYEEKDGKSIVTYLNMIPGSKICYINKATTGSIRWPLGTSILCDLGKEAELYFMFDCLFNFECI